MNWFFNLKKDTKLICIKDFFSKFEGDFIFKSGRKYSIRDISYGSETVIVEYFIDDNDSRWQRFSHGEKKFKYSSGGLNSIYDYFIIDRKQKIEKFLNYEK